MASYSSISLPEHQANIFTCGLLLPPEQERTAIELSQDIAKYNPHSLKFVLDKAKHPPYVRLYETVVPTKNIELAIKNLRRIIAPMSQFRMDWGEMEATKHLVSIWGKNNSVLAAFHQAVVLTISALREGDFKQKYLEEENEQEFTPQEEQNIRKWGSPWVEPYLPHLIIAKATPTFETEKTEMEWRFSHCLFKGVFAGVRPDYGDFIQSVRIPFLA